MPPDPDRAGLDDELAQIGYAMAQLTGRAHWLHPSPADFEAWLMNLDDVYLNVSLAWDATVPPSMFEAELEASGGSQRQRLARFRARDLYVLLEAWMPLPNQKPPKRQVEARRAEFRATLRKHAPDAADRVAQLIDEGAERGWLEQLRQIRHYMSHRDERDYHDIGRHELPVEAIEWMEKVRQSFDVLFLTGLGLQRFREAAVAAVLDAHASAQAGVDASTRELACAGVDKVLAGALNLLALAPEGDGNEYGNVLADMVNGFVIAVCAVPELWSECLTALVRRCVTAWARVEVSPEMTDLLRTSLVDADVQGFVAAVATTSADETPVSLADRSREAVHRVTAWLNGKNDLRSALAAAFTVTTNLVAGASLFEDEDINRQAWVQQLGAQADALLDS